MATTRKAGAKRRAGSGRGSAGRRGARPDVADGLARVVIESAWPEIDGGRHRAKAVLGETVACHADVYADGHDALGVVLLVRKAGAREWREVPMTFGIRDRWEAGFEAGELGIYEICFEGWIDRFATIRDAAKKKHAAGQEVALELREAAALLREAAARAKGDDGRLLERAAGRMVRGKVDTRVAAVLDPALEAPMRRHAPRPHAVRHPRVLEVVVDPPIARFSTWYEMFPRSASPEPGRHGTFEDVRARLPYVAGMGFDVLYLPPIHPIGRVKRKGPNGLTDAKKGDPGSPWAIGSKEGGHKSIHPELGTAAEFRALVKEARKKHGIEIALDIAFQCAPDHPYVKAHPEWFAHRADGSIHYAENPPKKYEDIYPFDFDSEAWPELWTELASIFEHWIGEGVRVFRVDNPHTKSFPFWEWCLEKLRLAHPEVVLLSEAFTRPRVMYGLAKAGFDQSYSYFAWKNARHEIERWWNETMSDEVRAVYRPNLWPNTPDILNAHLQHGGRPAFIARLVLAATLGASYGIYGPAFELCENVPREPGSEEYLGSEKYEIRHWDIEREGSLAPIITRVNRIRRENPALQSNDGFAFHRVDNGELLCFSKQTPDASNVVVVVVNLDPHHRQSGFVDLDLPRFGLPWDASYQVHDLLSDARYYWHGAKSYVELDPFVMPAHVLRLRRHVRTEADFDYYL